MEAWRINRTSLRRFGVDSCKEFAVILSLTAYKSVSLCVLSSWRSELKQRHWCESMCVQGAEEMKRRTRGRHWLKSALSDFLLVYWFSGLSRSPFPPLSLFLAARSFLYSQSDSDESRPSGAAPSIDSAYFPPSSPHSSAMLCIQNAEISPGGFEQGIYCYRRGEGRKRASRCY